VTRRHARTIAVAGLLLAALLVVVALASRGQLGADGAATARDGPSLPGGAFAYLYAGLLVAGVLALPLFFYVYAQNTPYSKSARRRARLTPFVLVAFVAAGLLVASVWGDELRDVLQRLEGWTGGDEDGADRAAPPPPAPEGLAVVVVSAFLVGSVATVVGWRFVRRRLREQTLAETLSDALDDTVEDVEAEPDPRRAIILAYARMEVALDRSGCSRHEAEAPLEYLARVLGELEVARAPVETLTELFERAKFGHHPIEPALKEQALAALREIRSELQERR
jgi:hypothetical protein